MDAAITRNDAAPTSPAPRPPQTLPDDAPDETSALAGEPLASPTMPALIDSLIAVILPFLGLLAAIILYWGTRFSWLNLGMLLGGYILTVLGITVGYHRLFTHKSCKTNLVVAAILGILGSMAVEGPVLQWVATHRRPPRPGLVATAHQLLRHPRPRPGRPRQRHQGSISRAHRSQAPPPHQTERFHRTKRRQRVCMTNFFTSPL